MEAKDLVTALERFFLDIIGVIAPGLALLLGGWFFLGQPHLALSVGITPPWSWLVPLLASYACGHALSSVGQKVILPIIEVLVYGPKRIPFFGQFIGWVDPEKSLFDSIHNSKIFVAFVKRMEARLPELEAESDSKTNVRQWRNVAISVVQDQSQTIYRAMFISAFNLGMATVCVLLGALWLGRIYLIHASATDLPSRWWSLVLLVSALAFLERHYYFYSIAIRLPFSMALTQLELSKKSETP